MVMVKGEEDNVFLKNFYRKIQHLIRGIYDRKYGIIL